MPCSEKQGKQQDVSCSYHELEANAAKRLLLAWTKRCVETPRDPSCRRAMAWKRSMISFQGCFRLVKQVDRGHSIFPIVSARSIVHGFD